MALWMHGFIPAEFGYHANVFCMFILRYDVQADGPFPTLILESDRTCLGVKARGSKVALYKVHLALDKGCMYWLVDNDPKAIQPPNGPIIWQWPAKEVQS